jgi:hypothetical protein
VTNDEEVNPPQSQSPNTSMAVPSLAGHSFYGQTQVGIFNLFSLPYFKLFLYFQETLYEQSARLLFMAVSY